MATGTVAITYSKSRTIRSVTWSWIATAGGAAGDVAVGISGEILRVVTNPGSPAPSDNYDITIVDDDGFDVCAGLAQNRDTVNTESFVPLTGDGTTTNQRFAVDGTLTLAVSNAGSGGAGTVTVYYR